MGIGKFFKDLVGGQPPVQKQAQEYAQYQQQNIKGKLAKSHRRASLLTLSEELKLHLAQNLKPLLEQEYFLYDDNPSIEQAYGSQIVIIDVTPMVNARMHDKYNQVLRVKKSMGKSHDLYCAIGRREDYKRYPRGTYPSLLYFCIVEGELNHRYPDLTVDGLATVEGPRLYNLADIGPALVKKANEPLKA